MKYWFFAAVFANFVLLLWEFHDGVFEVAGEPDNAPKQIMLLSEAAQQSAVTDVAAPSAPAQAQSAASDTASLAAATAQTPAAASTPGQIAENARQAQQPPAAAATLMSTTAALSSPLLPPVTSAGVADLAPGAEPTAAADDTQTAQPAPNSAAEQLAAAETATAAAPAEPASAAAEQQDVAPTSAETAAPQPEASKSAATHTVCYTAEQIENPAELKALLGKYRSQLQALELSSKETQVPGGSYLVYYPPAATLEKSIANAEKLRSDYAIEDLLVIREGDLKGAVSLGVFSNEERAKTAQSQFEKKGLQVQIRPRTIPAMRYTVKVRWTEQQNDSAEAFAKSLKSRFAPVGRLASCGG